jgi:hypothetical protein
VIEKIYRILLFTLLIGGFHSAFSQPVSQELPPASVVERLFYGMQMGDSAIVHSTFAKDVTLATIFRDKENAPIIKHETSIRDFLNAVGTAHKEIWYEENWNMKVEVDGDLAQVWCDYAFYLDDKFSHCGVDAFQLHRGKDGWKIFHLADTRRKTNCAIPESITKKHNGK